MKKQSKNQMAGHRGASKAAFYEPDEETLRRFNYSNGAGWRTKKPGNVSWKIARLGEGRRKYHV